jgi:uncharacterized membrane protein YdjX (TVP38/TMEM64 family)
VLLRRLLTFAWAALVIGIFGLYLLQPESFTAENFERILARWGPWAFPGFVVVSLLRGPLLVPSTPVVLAGGAFFPETLPAVLVVSMLGIIASATLLYRFPGFAGYDSMLAERYPEKLAHLRTRLAGPGAMWFVAAWAFFPAVPTDLICYAAGLVRMPYRRMLMGIIIGELPLVTAYIVLGAKLSEFLPI